MRDLGIIVIVVGAALLLLKNAISGIGAQIENTLSSSWTGIAVIAIGGVILLSESKKVKAHV